MASILAAAARSSSSSGRVAPAAAAGPLDSARAVLGPCRAAPTSRGVRRVLFSTRCLAKGGCQPNPRFFCVISGASGTRGCLAVADCALYLHDRRVGCRGRQRVGREPPSSHFDLSQIFLIESGPKSQKAEPLPSPSCHNCKLLAVWTSAELGCARSRHRPCPQIPILAPPPSNVNSGAAGGTAQLAAGTHHGGRCAGPGQRAALAGEGAR